MEQTRNHGKQITPQTELIRVTGIVAAAEHEIRNKRGIAANKQHLRQNSSRSSSSLFHPLSTTCASDFQRVSPAYRLLTYWKFLRCLVEKLRLGSTASPTHTIAVFHFSYVRAELSTPSRSFALHLFFIHSKLQPPPAAQDTFSLFLHAIQSSSPISCLGLLHLNTLIELSCSTQVSSYSCLHSSMADHCAGCTPLLLSTKSATRGRDTLLNTDPNAAQAASSKVECPLVPLSTLETLSGLKSEAQDDHFKHVAHQTKLDAAA
jgi:hypothetical protein